MANLFLPENKTSTTENYGKGSYRFVSSPDPLRNELLAYFRRTLADKELFLQGLPETERTALAKYIEEGIAEKTLVSWSRKLIRESRIDWKVIAHLQSSEGIKDKARLRLSLGFLLESRILQLGWPGWKVYGIFDKARRNGEESCLALEKDGDPVPCYFTQKFDAIAYMRGMNLTVQEWAIFPFLKASGPDGIFEPESENLLLLEGALGYRWRQYESN